jgi:DNA primase
VTDTLDPREYTLATVPSRVAQLGDVHEALLHGRRRLDSALELLAKRTRRA